MYAHTSTQLSMGYHDQVQYDISLNEGSECVLCGSNVVT